MKAACEQCKKNFEVKPSLRMAGWGKYCSSACHHISMRDGRMLNCHKCGKVIYRSMMQIKRSKSGKYFCDKSCQTKWRNAYFSGKKHANWLHGKSIYRNVLLRSKIPEVCKRCGSDDKRVLSAHHLDHDRRNNKIKNLTWLCQNCHFLIHCDKLEEKKFMEVLV